MDIKERIAALTEKEAKAALEWYVVKGFMDCDHCGYCFECSACRNKLFNDVLDTLKEAENILVDHAAIKKQYEEHGAKCKQIKKEIEKRGEKAAPNLAFLKKYS